MPDKNKIKFQGQEQQDAFDLGWYNFKWRMHNPEIGRFMCIDPLAEKYYYNSPYAFSGNRLIDAFELEGLEPVSYTGGPVQGGFSGYYTNDPYGVPFQWWESTMSWTQLLPEVVIPPQPIVKEDPLFTFGYDKPFKIGSWTLGHYCDYYSNEKGFGERGGGALLDSIL